MATAQHPIIDAHLDLAWNALSWNRDLTRPLQEIRAAEAAMIDRAARGKSAVCLPEMRRGNIALCLATLLARAKDVHPAEGFRRTDLDYATQDIACAIARGQLAYYRTLEQRGHIRFVTDTASLQAHWKSYAAHGQSTPLGVSLAMEGAGAIVEPV